MSLDDIESWIPVIAALGGALFGWFAKVWESYASTRRKQRERVAERSEESSALLMEVVTSMRTHFDEYWGRFDGPPQTEMREDFELARRLAVDIVPGEAREKLVQAINALYFYHGVSPHGPQEDWYPYTTAYKASEEAFSVIGAIRRAEKIPATPDLTEMTKRLNDFERSLEQQDRRGDSGDGA